MRRDLTGPGVTAATAADAGGGRAAGARAGRLPVHRQGASARTSSPKASSPRPSVLAGALTPIAGLDLALEGLVWEQSGRIMATNTAAEVMGNPLNSLAWIANSSGLARPLAQGRATWSTTGSVSALLRPKAGDTVARELHAAGRGLGALRLMRAAAE
mgnify:CR=1 FL=1